MSQLSEKDKKAIRKAYRELDDNGDGRISMAEAKRASKKLGIQLTDRQLIQAIGDLDENDDGYLNYKEFEKIIVEHIENETMEMNLIRQMYQNMDVDGDGNVTCAEIEKSLGVSKKEAQELLAEADTNGDGKMSFDGFPKIGIRDGRTKVLNYFIDAVNFTQTRDTKI